MNEAEWLACLDPLPMLQHLGSRLTRRQQTLFGLALCRPRRLYDPASAACFEVPLAAEALRLVEECLEGLRSAGELVPLGERIGTLVSFASGGYEITAFRAVSYVVHPERRLTPATLHSAAQFVAQCCQFMAGAERVRFLNEPGFEAGQQDERERQANLLRCLVGNPFRPISFAAEWGTSAVLGIAEHVYADRRFDLLPILADALQDAGCEDPNILAHCREPGEHARGCWVVDNVLGKS